MQRHVGDEFTATVSSVTAFGFFVLLDAYYVEGLVHISSLEDDYYQFVEEQYALVGERTRRRFRLGDPVKVRVARVDVEERKIDFVLIEDSKDKRRLKKATQKGGETANQGALRRDEPLLTHYFGIACVVPPG
jgi:ribonuclease R